MADKPITSLRYRTLDVAIFGNKTKENKTFYTCVVSKSYKDKNNQWQKQSISLNQDNLLELASLLDKTFWEINAIGSNSTPDERKSEKGISTPSENKNDSTGDLDEYFETIPF